MSEITELLNAIEDGDTDARTRLFEHVYRQLKSIAQSRMLGERDGHTLQATALVNEAYLRLFERGPESASSTWNGSRHFYGAAANAMRQILIESARSRQRKKRGGDMNRLFVDPDGLVAPDRADEVLALDESLDRFGEVQPVMAELVRLRFFAGLTIREAAEQVGVSSRTADDYWAYAKVWLLADLQDASR